MLIKALQSGQKCLISETISEPTSLARCCPVTEECCKVIVNVVRHRPSSSYLDHFVPEKYPLWDSKRRLLIVDNASLAQTKKIELASLRGALSAGLQSDFFSDLIAKSQLTQRLCHAHLLNERSLKSRLSVLLISESTVLPPSEGEALFNAPWTFDF